MPTLAPRIVHRQRLHFSSTEALREYYEDKYRAGGYKEGGVLVHGIDISALYHARRQEATVTLLAARANEVVLDAGCGNGSLSARLAAIARDVHAIDIAANALDPVFASIQNLHFRPMDLEALEYPDSHFDGIACVETLEHLLHPERAITELYRVLKPGGRLVLTYPTINRTIAKRLRLGAKVSISEHLNEWSLSELRTVVQRIGLRIEAVEGISFDFGALLALKKVNRFFASSITQASLAIRAFPANSMFVAMLLRKPE